MPGLKKIIKWQWSGTRPKMLSKEELNEVWSDPRNIFLLYVDYQFTWFNYTPPKLKPFVKLQISNFHKAIAGHRDELGGH